MDSAIGFYLDPADLLVVGALSLLLVAGVVLAVGVLAPRRGWTADAAAALAWSSSAASVSLLSLVLIAPWERPTRRLAAELGDAQVHAYSGGGVFTLVWLPPVMALLWSVLHVLRSGTGHHSPLLGVPTALTIPALWLVSAPLQITVLTVGILGALSWAGLVIWGLGQAAVAVGRSWVGDIGVWTGIALVAADAWPGYVGLVSPVVVAALVLLQQRRGADGVRVS